MKVHALYLAALVALVVGWRACDVRRQQEIGALRATAARLARDRATGIARAESLARVERVQVETLRLVQTRRDTVLRTIDRWLTDTVPVPVEVVRAVVRVDSVVIASCGSALATCQQRAGALQHALARSDSLVMVWRRAAQPSLVRQVTDRLPWLAAGYLLGSLTPFTPEQ